MSGMSIDLREASGPTDMDEARTLFLEYGESLGFSLCFQGFDQELAALPGCYARPAGRILLAETGQRAAGIIALRPLDTDGVCEMKRLYVRPDFRGRALGRKLAETIITSARAIGYARMVLDTVETMTEARNLYDTLGFIEIPPYYDNPLEGVRYYGLDLQVGP